MSNVNLAAPGNYYISSGKSFAGRDFLKEDRTFDPKKINCPTDERSPDPASTLPSNTFDLNLTLSNSCSGVWNCFLVTAIISVSWGRRLEKETGLYLRS